MISITFWLLENTQFHVNCKCKQAGIFLPNIPRRFKTFSLYWTYTTNDFEKGGVNI